ncbi:MAG TPA: hypothetical protein VF230_12820 [Acidimicrobiales bacterium]
MTGDGTVELAALRIGDRPDVWRDLGFVVDGDEAHASGVCFGLGGGGRGITGWSVRGVTGVGEIAGVRLDLPAPPSRRTPDHPNGVVALDHVVLLTPDLPKTIAGFDRVGVPVRRMRDVEPSPRQQAFFKLGGVVVEVVGPAGTEPAFWGLAWTVRDLEETKALLGDRLRGPKPAVQPGRRIATLERSAGSTVPMAFMSPHVPSTRP